MYIFSALPYIQYVVYTHFIYLGASNVTLLIPPPSRKMSADPEEWSCKKILYNVYIHLLEVLNGKGKVLLSVTSC